MNNAEYWKQRFGQLERSRHISNGNKYREIERLFSKSQQALEAKINAWYGRFAVNNGVSLEEAHKMLSRSELAELRWDINDYIKAGKENALNDRFHKQLENASAKYHISRLEALKLQSQMECERLYGNLTDAIDEHIKNQYADAYYHTAFEIERGMGIGKSLERINADKIAQIVGKPWAVDQKTFVTRFGESKIKLINNVQNSLVRMCLAGGSPDTAIRELAKTMQCDKARAGRIIMTESAYFAQNAQKQCFNALGVQEYEIVATLDSRTCSGACAGKDGEHYPMKMFQAGVTAPPFHPNCRCCTAPYFDDEWSKGERAARDEDGETYYVPSDMKYSEWKKAFVEGDKTAFTVKETSFISKKDDETEFSVNRELVNTKEYHDKFEYLTDHKKANESVYQEAMKILEHRDNTIFEDLVALDASTGEKIVENLSSFEAGKTGLTKEQYDVLKNHKGNKILLHNHPNSSRPSFADIKSIFENDDIAASVIIGHNGSVHVISDMDRQKDIAEYYKTLYDAYKLDKGSRFAEIKALDDLYSMGCFKYRKW